MREPRNILPEKILLHIQKAFSEKFKIPFMEIDTEDIRSELKSYVVSNKNLVGLAIYSVYSERNGFSKKTIQDAFKRNGREEDGASLLLSNLLCMYAFKGKKLSQVLNLKSIGLKNYDIRKESKAIKDNYRKATLEYSNNSKSAQSLITDSEVYKHEVDYDVDDSNNPIENIIRLRNKIPQYLFLYSKNRVAFLELSLRAAYHYFRKKQYTEAINLCTEIVEYQPNFVLANHILALINYKLCNLEEALRHTEITLQVEPKYAYSSILHGNILMLQKRHEEAISIFNNLINDKRTTSSKLILTNFHIEVPATLIDPNYYEPYRINEFVVMISVLNKSLCELIDLDVRSAVRTMSEAMQYHNSGCPMLFSAMREKIFSYKKYLRGEDSKLMQYADGLWSVEFSSTLSEVCIAISGSKDKEYKQKWFRPVLDLGFHQEDQMDFILTNRLKLGITQLYSIYSSLYYSPHL